MSPQTDNRPFLGRGALLLGAAGLVAGLAVVWTVLGLSGELAPPVSGLGDVGPFVRFALPAARTVHDLSAALTIGALVVGAWLVAPEPGSSSEELSGRRQRLVRVGFAAAVIWGCSCAAVIVLTASDLSGIPVGQSGFGTTVVSFVSQTDLGRQLSVSLVLVILAANLA